jgi:hypothetical protein
MMNKSTYSMCNVYISASFRACPGIQSNKSRPSGGAFLLDAGIHRHDGLIGTLIPNTYFDIVDIVARMEPGEIRESEPGFHFIPSRLHNHKS